MRRVVPAAILCALVMLVLVAPPARAQQGSPMQATVTVVPPSDAGAPRPTGGIVLSVDGSKVGTIPLIPGTGALTRVTPLVSATFAVLGQEVKVRYTGDSNYEASDGVMLTFPTPSLVTITATPRDVVAPAIDITSPGDGVRYAVGESVFAIYTCADPDARSAVTTCEGPVAPGGAIDTSTAGRYSFTVKTADALGNAATKTVKFQVAASSAASPPPPPPPPPPDDRSSSTPPPATPASGTPPAVAPPPPAGEPPEPEPSETPAAAPTSGQSSVDAARPAAANEPTAAASKPATQHAEYKPYDPRSEPGKVVATFVAGFALLQMGAGGGGLALAGRGGGLGGANGGPQSGGTGSAGSGGQASTKSESIDYEAVDVMYIGGVAAVASGDRSRSWRWPGTRSIDRLAIYLGDRLAPRAPLVARLVTDGTAMRAMFGSLSQLVPLAGLVLGILAVQDTGGQAVPPAAGLTIAIAAIAVIDAGAGMVAVLTFLVGVIANGGLNTNNDLRLLLGLTAMWCVVTVLAGAARPLRRVAARGPVETWDRVADFVIAGLIGAWAVQKIVQALPGLAGKELEIAQHANTAAYCVLGALVLRLGIETVAAHMYPLRVTVAHPETLADPPALQRLGATALRTTIFLFLAYVVVGWSWQLWVGTAMFVIPQVLSIYEDRLPNSPLLYRVLPKGLVQLVTMLLVGSALGLLLVQIMNERAHDFLATSLVLLALPGFALSLVALFGREGDEPRIGWGKRFAGVGLLVLGVLLALGIVLGTS